LSARRIRVPKIFLPTVLLAGVALVAGVLAAAPGQAATPIGTPTPTGTWSPTPSGPLTTPTRPATSTPPATSLSPTMSASCPTKPTLPVEIPGTPIKTYDFEDGTVQGWYTAGGASVANSTEVAEGGSHSLRVDGLTASNSARTMVSGFGGYGWYKVTAKVRIGGNGPATRIALRPLDADATIPGSAQVTGSGWTTLTAYLRPGVFYVDTFCGSTPGWSQPADAGLSLVIDQTTCGPATGPLASTVFVDSVTVDSVPRETPPPGVTPTPTPTAGATGPIPAPAVSSCPTPPITTTPVAGTCTVHYVDNPWPGAHQATVTIDNLTTVDKPTWTLTWDFGDDQKITNLWSAAYEQVGRHLALHSLSYTPLHAKSSVVLGFIATAPGSLTRPGNVLLDGQPCTLV
jgi:hypothetical protein